MQRFRILLSFIFSSIALFICGFSVTGAFAQATVPLKNYTINDGLSSSEVYHVMQDSRGFMWFGTDHGVCRYDGYQFKTFTTSDGLADNTIFECMEDYKGRIWFRSYSGRLSYYYHDSIFSLPCNEKLKNILGISLITSFVIDSSDNVYIASHLLPGIIKIDLKQKNSIQLISLPVNINYLINVSGVRTPIFGSTMYGIKDIVESNINIYNITPGHPNPVKQAEISMNMNNNQGGTHVFLQAIKLPNNEICLSLGRNFMVLRNNKVIYSHYFNSYVTKLGYGYSGKIWVVLQYDAPVCYNNDTIEQLPLIMEVKDKQITSSTVDAEGGLWLTSLTNGVYYLSSPVFMIRTKESGLPCNKINYMNIAPDSTLWISTSPGNILTIIDNGIAKYHTINAISNSTSINSILFQKDNTVWFIGSADIHIYKMYDFLHPLAAKYNGVGKDMVQNEDGTVWLNGFSNLQLLKLDKDSFRILKTLQLGIIIKKMVMAQDNSLWLGTLNGLYQYVNNALFNWGNIFPVLKKRIDDLKLSPNGDLWIATRDTGLILKNKNHFRYFNGKNGLVNNFSHCLSFDYKGNLWVGTNAGLSHLILHYDKERNCIVDSIKNITSPVLKEITYLACNKNEVYVGTNNGLVSFDMNNISSNKTPPPVYIMGFKIDNKDFPATQQNLDLEYDKNNIVINYVGLTYRDASSILYRYRMKGVDTGWVYTQYTVVQYPKLPPGDYSFMVSARNSDGVWSKNSATVSFTINPPLWGRWWAKILLTVSLILLTYWRISVLLKRERIKAGAKQKLIEMQLKELREQMDPHFLFNNLNTLYYLVESKSSNAPIFVDELSKYFRYSLQSRNVEFTELKNELEQAKRYLHLLKIRYEDELIVQWDIYDIMLNYFISNHSLQLLLENIIKHNILSRENPLFVEIKTTGNSLIVKNNLQPKLGTEESTGLGLKSIDERYHILFKKNIKIFRNVDSFCVELPLLTPDEYESIDY